MKYLFAAILLVSFTGLAVFGIFGIHAGMQNHDGSCIAAKVQGTDCPTQSNPVNYLTFHLDAFNNFLTAAFSDGATLLLILFLCAIGIISGALRGDVAHPQFAYCRFKRSDSFTSPLQFGLIRWLALHENSPAIS